MENKKGDKRIIGRVEQVFRRMVQIISFIFLPSLFSKIFQSMKNILMAVFHQTEGFMDLIPDISMLLIITLVTFFMGRFFCGWLCAFGSMGDAIYGMRRFIFKKAKTIPEKIDQVLKAIKYLIFVGTIILVWGLQIITIPTGANPWDLFGMLVSFNNFPTISMLEGWMVASAILFGIILGSFFVERFFCRYLCPLGAYFTLLCRFRLFTIRKPCENCGKCTLCTKKCSMGIHMTAVDIVTSGECIHCMECKSNCPKKNVNLAVGETKKKYIIAGTMACLVIIAAFLLSNVLENKILLIIGANSTTESEIGTIIQSDSLWNEGVYEGTANGFRGAITVQVEITNGVISDIKILSDNEDAQYISRASSQILPTILSSQSTEVDAVSGATYSSVGLIGAVNDALLQAEKASESTSTSGVKVEEETTSITNEVIDPSSEESSQEVSNQEVSNQEVSVLADIDDGIYEGIGTGFRGDIVARVTVKNASIAAIEIVSYQDDQQYFDYAVDTIIDEIITSQVVSVDAVSGATYSSNGIMQAVADALNLEYTSQPITEGKRKH